MIYLDSAATTRIAPEVLEAMMPYLTDEYGNPGSRHSFGCSARTAVEAARAQVAKLFSCQPENIIFTSGGTEGNNMVIGGFWDARAIAAVSAVEHDSVVRSALESVWLTERIPPSVSELERCLSENSVGLVSVMYVNNETGAVNDIDAIAELCHRHGTAFHSDCVQAAGEYDLSAIKHRFDFATISSHKIHGPKGVGAVYVRNREQLDPIIYGGSEQEFGLRGGTENVAGIVGFGKACEIAAEQYKQNSVRVSSLKQSFVFALKREFEVDKLEDAGIFLNGVESYMAPGKIINLRIDGVLGDTLVLMADAMGVCISAGSACRAHEDKPNAALMAYGLTEREARSSIRVSFSKYNTHTETEEAAHIIADCIKTLRAAAKEDI